MEYARFDELRTLQSTPSPRKSAKTPTIRSRHTEWSRHRQQSRDKSRNSQRQMPTQTRPFVPDPVGRPLPSIDHEGRCRQLTTQSQRAETNSKMRKEARSKLSDRSRQQSEQSYIPDEIGRPLPHLDHEDRQRQLTSRSQGADIITTSRKDTRSKATNKQRSFLATITDPLKYQCSNPQNCLQGGVDL